MDILAYVVLTVVSTGVVWYGSGMLETAAERLSVFYELPPIVQGAIVVAVGSSFPELSTVVISTLVHGTFELGVSAIVGSAIFNILFIPAISGLVAERQMASNRSLVYKEAQFYIIAVAVLLLTFSFAVIYFPVEGSGPAIRGEVTRLLALMPITMYGLYIFIQYQDTMDHDPADVDEEIRVLRQWIFLLLSLGVILVGVEGLVRSAVRFGELFNAPSWLWGITIVAAGTSIPDAFVSARAARDGKAVTSLANVLGSNVFDLLICVPIGVMITGSETINFSIAAPMMGVLTLATIVLFGLMRTRMVLSRWESVVLMLLYLAFVTWVALESFGVVDVVRSLPPANPVTH